MSAIKALSVFSLGVGLLSVAGCSGTSGTTPGPATPNYDVTWSFERIPVSGLDSVEVTLNLLKDNVANSTSDFSIEIESPDETTITRDDVQDNGNGEHVFTIMPSQTGEYKISLTYAGNTYTQTPIVLDDVASGWQQPMSVQGLVNSKGFEGGAHITADANWLFIQYSPVSASSNLFLQNNSIGCNGDLPSCNSPLVNQTTEAAEFTSFFGVSLRPNFPQGRLSLQFNDDNVATGFANINHYATLFNDNTSFRPPSAFYGFKRSSEGSFSSIFTLAIDDQNEAVLNAQGLSVTLDSAGNPTAVYSFVDPTNPRADDNIQLGDNNPDIYTRTFTLGISSYLARYSRNATSGDITQFSTSPAVPIDLGDISGRQSNPYLYVKTGDTVDSLWIDNQGNLLDADNIGDISVYPLIDDREFDSAQILPAKINTTNRESQAFFTGNKLLYRQAVSDYGNLMQVAYMGGNYTDAANWGTPENLMVSSADNIKGSIVTLGDPSIGKIDGKEILYFTYGKVRENINGFLDIDMQVGYLEKETAL